MDTRPRFGWIDPKDLDNDPQKIREKKVRKDDVYVAVIPLPFNSGKVRKEVREFTKRLTPTTR